MTNKLLLLMFVAAVGLALGSAQGTAQGKPQGTATALTSPVTGNAVTGKKLYYDHACYSCHGFNGETGARPFVPNWPANLATEGSFTAFLRGRANLSPVQPSTAMPNYPVQSVSDAQARDIYAQTDGLGTEEAVKVLVSLAKLEPDPVKRTALLEDVLARRIALYGETHRNVADTLDDLGNAAVDAGQYDRAAELYQRSIAMFERSLGPGDPHITVPLSNAGELAIKRGKFADAVTACERALAIDTAALGADHPDLAYDLTCLGEARLGQHDAAGAREVLERANMLRGDGNAPPDEVARTRDDLARAQKALRRNGPAR